MVLLGHTFGVDESFIKGKELINTNSSQNILNNTGTQCQGIQLNCIFNSAQLNIESLGAHTMIREHISERVRKTKDEPRQSSHCGKWIEHRVCQQTHSQPLVAGNQLLLQTNQLLQD